MVLCRKLVDSECVHHLGKGVIKNFLLLRLVKAFNLGLRHLR